MTLEIEKKLREVARSRIETIVENLEYALRRSTLVFQSILGSLAIGIAIQFALSFKELHFSDKLWGQLGIFTILLIVYVVFIVLEHWRELLRQARSINDKSMAQMDRAQASFRNYMDHLADKMNAHDYIELYQRSLAVYNVTSISDVDRKLGVIMTAMVDLQNRSRPRNKFGVPATVKAIVKRGESQGESAEQIEHDIDRALGPPKEEPATSTTIV